LHIKLYRQEYVYLPESQPALLEPPGWWPDPLVPFLNPYDAKPVSAMRLSREEQNGKISYQCPALALPETASRFGRPETSLCGRMSTFLQTNILEGIRARSRFNFRKLKPSRFR
jgi:hypothetical protein